MLQIDSGIVATIITVLFTLMGLAAGLGALSQKVKAHDKDISTINTINETSRFENRQEHQQIFNKLEDINKFVRTGKD